MSDATNLARHIVAGRTSARAAVEMGSNSSSVGWAAFAAFKEAAGQPTEQYASLDDIAPWPRLRALLSFLPIHLLEAAAEPASFIIGVNLQGEVTHNLQDQGHAFHYITGVTPCGDTLYLGSLRTNAIGVLPIP